jgi:RecA-family ATPase
MIGDSMTIVNHQTDNSGSNAPFRVLRLVRNDDARQAALDAWPVYGGSTTAGGSSTAPYLPDVTGLSLLNAALALAEQGIYLLLVKTGKHPGSHAGKGWPAKSTCDPDTIRAWCTAYPEAGIAIHTGRSGLAVGDLDVNEIPDELTWLKAGLFQSTRGGLGDRGHYVFASTETFVSGKLKLKDGTVVGEIRSGNTVIVTQPSPHQKADERGEYRWMTTGVVPELPDEANEYLTTKAGSGVVERVPLQSNADGEAYWAAHTEEREPWRRKVFRDKYAEYVGSREKHHDAMMKVLGWAAREVEAGYVSATLFDDLYEDWLQSFGENDRTPPAGEFPAMVRTAVGQAQAEDPDDLRNRGNRDFGDDTRDYAGFFDGLQFIVESNGQAPQDGSNDSSANTMKNGDENGSKERVTRCLADVTPTRVQWLWRPWIPLGKVSIAEGDPDVGKSTLTLSWAALVSTGRQWPQSIVDDNPLPRSKSDPAGVVLVGIEDDESDTIVPRLIAAGADLGRIHTLAQPTDSNGDPVPFVIPDDIDRLRKAIIEVNAKLIVIDPITAYLSTKQVKAGDDPSTRQALMPLVDLARELLCAIVLVRHLNKATGMSAKHRGSGTIAYTGITRSVIVAGEIKRGPTDPGPTPDDPTYAIARTKGNLAKAPKAIGYRLDTSPGNAEAPVVKWLGALDISADDLVRAEGTKMDARVNAPTRESAIDTIADMLKDGPQKAEDVITTVCQNEQCSKNTVKAAAKRLGVIKKKVYVNGKIHHWTWELPPDVINNNLKRTTTTKMRSKPAKKLLTSLETNVPYT